MPWAIYSPEDYPKWDVDNNCQTDYRQALGVQVILHAHQWTEVEDFYKHVRYESWVDASGEGRESVITGRQLCERMAGDFKLRGIRSANLDRITEKEKKAIEQDGEEQNLKFRKMFVNRFEEQFRVKTQGGPGRWTPNTYEAECYALLNLKPPDVVQRIPEQQKSEPVIIEQKIDPEFLQQLISQRKLRGKHGGNTEAQQK
jgi:hypothetical protein